MLETTKTLPALLTQKQAAEYLSKSPKWFERDRWVGPTIPFVKIGRSVRYRAVDLLKYVEGNIQDGGQTSMVQNGRC